MPKTSASMSSTSTQRLSCGQRHSHSFCKVHTSIGQTLPGENSFEFRIYSTLLFSFWPCRMPSSVVCQSISFESQFQCQRRNDRIHRQR